MKYVTFLAALAAAAPAAASSTEYQDLASLEMRVANFLTGGGVPIPIDRRVKLVKCPAEPELSPPANGVVAVRCPSAGWRIAVLVAGSPHAAESPDVLVRRGDTIELVAKGSGYSVSATGVALDEGGTGKTIRVKMSTSTSPVSAVVTRAGAASISH